MSNKEKNQQEISSTHLLLRMQRFFNKKHENIDVVKVHNAIIKEHGEVAVAKLGAHLSVSRFEVLSQSILSGNTTRLYLVFKDRDSGELDVYSAKVFRLCLGSKTDPPAPVPEYYKDVGGSLAFWCVLKEPLKKSSISKLRLYSTGRVLKDVLAESNTTMMLVNEIHRVPHN